MNENTILRDISNTGTYSRAMKKKIGSFYTPKGLADAIALETLDAWMVDNLREKGVNAGSIDALKPSSRKRVLDDIKRVRILDPAVGAGAFLLAAAEWLEKTRISLNDQHDQRIIRREIVENNLYGVDLDADAVESCIYHLKNWSVNKVSGFVEKTENQISRIKQGNSLLGYINRNTEREVFGIETTSMFHWYQEIDDLDVGFDIILGNPPYGNILDSNERRFIASTYGYNVGGGKQGTWNSAAHFIVRSRELLRPGGYLGLLVPNSILRVGQFTKTRKYLLEDLRLWKIIDEGSPFDDVTLEMVTIFCQANNYHKNDQVKIESRRPGHEHNNSIDWNLLKQGRIFSIYYDTIFARISQRGKKNMLSASRGRDIPKEYVSSSRNERFHIPYITSGRSVQRYRIIEKHQIYADEWCLKDCGMKDSFDNELLVSTKNFRHPRCVLKPKGIIHGGGIVRIIPLFQGSDIRVLGLILNSRLIQYICTRYLTNYSQLTTCLNTGIMEDIPLIVPKYAQPYKVLFDSIYSLYNSEYEETNQIARFIETVSDALVYDLYFSNDEAFQEMIASVMNDRAGRIKDPYHLYKILYREDVLQAINTIMKNVYVRKIEKQIGQH